MGYVTNKKTVVRKNWITDIQLNKGLTSANLYCIIKLSNTKKEF